MKVIVSILTFLMSFLSGKSYSQPDPAKQRFDEYTKGLNITEKKQESFESPEGVVRSYSAIAKDKEIGELPVSAEQIAEINRAVSYAPKFAEMYAGFTGDVITPNVLDVAFKNWKEKRSNSPFDEESVIFVVGAAFGEYCNKHLNMKWVVVDDEFGQELAIRFVEKVVYGYPFSTVEKRINTSESGFLVLTFHQLDHSSKQTNIQDVETVK